MSQVNIEEKKGYNIVCLGKNRCYYEDIINYILKTDENSNESFEVMKKGKTNLLFGVHEVCKFFYPNIINDNSCIIFNTEQLDMKSEYVNSNYIKCLKTNQVMDYCESNRRWLTNNLNISSSKLFNLGYHEIYNNIRLDIDVLFYGTLTDTRHDLLKNIKDKLERDGFNMKYYFQVWGDEKQDLINRSKIILNLHRYETRLFQIVKAFPLLSSKKFIISETCSDEMDYSKYKIIFCNQELLYDKILYFLKNEHEMKEIVEFNYEVIKNE